MKVLSLYAFLQGIAALAVPISLRESQMVFNGINRNIATPGSLPSTSLVAVTFIPSALLFAFGIILWLNAVSTESGLAQEKSSEENPGGLTPQILQGIVFSALGIWIFSQSISTLANVVSAISVLKLESTRSFFSRLPYLRLIQALAQMIFGIWLMVGSKSLTRLRTWLLENANPTAQKD